MAGRESLVWIALIALAAAPAVSAADMDGDGVADPSDACCNTPPGVSVDGQGRPLGDLDFDCDVDLMDFAIFAQNMTGPLAWVFCPDCGDGVQNGTETDNDCGGPDCLPCANGLGCLVDSDCQSLVCNIGLGICMAPSCSDGVNNGNETGVDCGGGTCFPCPPGQGCLVASDCQSLVCGGGNICAAPCCMDGVQNGGETGVDCGGTCAPCGLPNSSPCTNNSECLSFNCVDGVCCDSACNFTCEACDVPGFIGTCVNIPNGQDPDFECAGATTCNGSGACTTLLPNGSACSSAGQCSSSQCVDGVCCNSACGSLCQACNLTGSVGSCSNIPNGADPANECAGANTCNGTGSCTP